MKSFIKIISPCLLLVLIPIIIGIAGCQKATKDTAAVTSDSVKGDGFVRIFDG